VFVLVAGAANAFAAGETSVFGTWNKNQSLSKSDPAELEPPAITLTLEPAGDDGLVYGWHTKTPDGKVGGFTVRASFDGVEKFRDGDVGTMLFWRTKDGGFWDSWHVSGFRRGFEVCSLLDAGKRMECQGMQWDWNNKPIPLLAVFDRVK
jgi:hypothetical protein